MRQLRLVGVEGEEGALVLAGPDGERFTLAVDDAVRAAVTGDRSRLTQLVNDGESRLRPRDIQARIRAGQTAEEVAAAAGVPVERVRRFEGPVLAERQHLASLAQRAPIKGPGEASGPPLGELVAERMGRRTADEEGPEWDSWRLDDHQWQVSVSWDDHGTTRASLWYYDTVRRCVTPADDESRLMLAGPDGAEGTHPDDGDVRPFRPRLATTSPRRPTEHAEQSDPTERHPSAAAAGVSAPTPPPTAERPEAARARPPRGPRDRRRVAVPSWDEILLGRKPPD